MQLAGHPVGDRGRLWEGATRTGSRPFTDNVQVVVDEVLPARGFRNSCCGDSTRCKTSRPGSRNIAADRGPRRHAGHERQATLDADDHRHRQDLLEEASQRRQERLPIQALICPRMAGHRCSPRCRPALLEGSGSNVSIIGSARSTPEFAVLQVAKGHIRIGASRTTGRQITRQERCK